MSIAVSAVIAPSRLLRLALALCAAVNLGAALLFVVSPHFVALPWLVAACCTLAAGGAAHAWVQAAKRRLIDISGLGDIRVSVQRKTGEAGRKNDDEHAPLRLMPGSTVWPGMLVLLLASDTEKAAPLLVLKDSVGAGEFRALAVAVRTIGGQAGQARNSFEPHKIL